MAEESTRAALGCGCVFDLATGLYHKLCDDYASVIGIEATAPGSPAREKVVARESEPE